MLIYLGALSLAMNGKNVDGSWQRMIWLLRGLRLPQTMVVSLGGTRRRGLSLRHGGGIRRRGQSLRRGGGTVVLVLGTGTGDLHLFDACSTWKLHVVSSMQADVGICWIYTLSLLIMWSNLLLACALQCASRCWHLLELQMVSLVHVVTPKMVRAPSENPSDCSSCHLS